MGEILLYIVLTSFLPVLLLLVFLEKRSRRVMLSFLCGVLVCFIAYFVNTFVYQSGNISNSNYSALFAPVIEEFLKFIPILLFSIILKKGKRQTVATSFALGVGFCVVENYYYLFSNAHNIDVFWIVVRCVGTGLMHSITSTFIGFGLYEARMNTKKSLLIGFGALIIAISYHFLYNFLIGNASMFIIGIFIPIISYIALFAFFKKDVIKAFYE